VDLSFPFDKAKPISVLKYSLLKDTRQDWVILFF